MPDGNSNQSTVEYYTNLEKKKVKIFQGNSG
jgi:hypothetical protein